MLVEYAIRKSNIVKWFVFFIATIGTYIVYSFCILTLSNLLFRNMDNHGLFTFCILPIAVSYHAYKVLPKKQLVTAWVIALIWIGGWCFEILFMGISKTRLLFCVLQSISFIICNIKLKQKLTLRFHVKTIEG